MSVHSNDRFVAATFPIAGSKKNRNMSVFTKELLEIIQNTSSTKASRIKGKTSADFLDSLLYSIRNEFIKDTMDKFDPYVSGQRLYLLQPRQCGRSLAKLYFSESAFAGYPESVFIGYYQKAIRESYRVMSISEFNSILEEIHSNIKEDTRHGKQREDYTNYSRAESIRENCKLPWISKRRRVTERLRRSIKGSN